MTLLFAATKRGKQIPIFSQRGKVRLFQIYGVLMLGVLAFPDACLQWLYDKNGTHLLDGVIFCVSQIADLSRAIGLFSFLQILHQQFLDFMTPT